MQSQSTHSFGNNQCSVTAKPNVPSPFPHECPIFRTPIPYAYPVFRINFFRLTYPAPKTPQGGVAGPRLCQLWHQPQTFLIRARGVLHTNIWFGPTFKSSTDGLKDGRELQSSSNGYTIDMHDGRYDDTRFGQTSDCYLIHSLQRIEYTTWT